MVIYTRKVNSVADPNESAGRKRWKMEKLYDIIKEDVEYGTTELIFSGLVLEEAETEAYRLGDNAPYGVYYDVVDHQ